MGNRVPQTVVHSFRTVVIDSGANHGLIISSGGFQPALTQNPFQPPVRQFWATEPPA
jgi:hypothetical protein